MTMTGNGAVLSIFSGLDLLGMGFEEQGYCVVGFIDTKWGRDVRRLHPPADVFEGVIGGDPCQEHSRLAALVRHNGHEPRYPDMTPEYVRVIEEAAPRWFVRENVPDAPLPHVAGYDLWNVLLVDAHVGGTQPRQRRICFGMREGLWPDVLRSPLSLIEYTEGLPAATSMIASDSGIAYEQNRRRPQSIYAGGGGVLPHNGSVLSIEDACEAMGLPREYFPKDSPFTVKGKRELLGNGVPLAMARAVAKAVREAAR